MAAIQNLIRRGETWWWRRKVTIAGRQLALAFSLRTPDHRKARSIGLRMAVALEGVLMAYAQRGTLVGEQTLKAVFTDAMRWQLERILSDQLDGGYPEQHRLANRLYGELWRLYSRSGPDAKYTADDDKRLAAAGWSAEERMHPATLWESSRSGEATISVRQTDALRSDSASKRPAQISIASNASSFAPARRRAMKPLAGSTPVRCFGSTGGPRRHWSRATTWQSRTPLPLRASLNRPRPRSRLQRRPLRPSPPLDRRSCCAKRQRSASPPTRGRRRGRRRRAGRCGPRSAFSSSRTAARSSSTTLPNRTFAT